MEFQFADTLFTRSTTGSMREITNVVMITVKNSVSNTPIGTQKTSVLRRMKKREKQPLFLKVHVKTMKLPRCSVFGLCVILIIYLPWREWWTYTTKTWQQACHVIKSVGSHTPALCISDYLYNMEDNISNDSSSSVSASVCFWFLILISRKWLSRKELLMQVIQYPFGLPCLLLIIPLML